VAFVTIIFMTSVNDVILCSAVLVELRLVSDRETDRHRATAYIALA